MKRHVVTVAIVVLASYAFLVTLAAGWLTFERRSREELLQALALATPGVHISEVCRQIGQPMGEWSSTDDVLDRALELLPLAPRRELSTASRNVR